MPNTINSSSSNLFTPLKNKLDLLPHSVREIADVIGLQKALVLAARVPRCFSGQPGKKSHHAILYIPLEATLTDRHMLVDLLGWDDARRMCRVFGGLILKPANCSELLRHQRNCSILHFIYGKHLSPQTAADMVGVGLRTVQNLVRDYEEARLAAANEEALG